MDKVIRIQTHHTCGGQFGYWLRRVVHLGLAIIPLLYYHFGQPRRLVVWLVVASVVIELLRLSLKITVWGHRDYERKQISSFAWGLFALGLVLIFSPSAAVAIPIIWSCAFVDPLLGELRCFHCSSLLVSVVGLMVLLLIWWGAAFWLGTAWWYALIMAPIILLVERPNFKWVDDNALMQLVPLVIVLIIEIL